MTLANVLTALVALCHIGFLVLEMFFWNHPIGQRIFSMTPEVAGALPAGPWPLRIAEAPAHRPRGPIECGSASRHSVSRGEGPLPPLGALPAHYGLSTRA